MQLLSKQIQEIMRNMECSKGFKCCENRFAGIAGTKRFLSDYFTCVGTNPGSCGHSLHFGYAYYCFCPVLQFVAREIYHEQGTAEPQYLIGKGKGAGDYF